MTDRPMKILMCHPGASWSTADVHNGLRFGLSALGVQTYNYQLDVRIARSGRWLVWNWKQSGKNGEKPNPRDVQYHAGEGLIGRALRLEPDWILVVSGMYLDIEIVRHLKRIGFKLAVLLTESPYDDLAQAEFIRLFDVAWTNDRSSVARLTACAPDTRVSYLGPAWHPLVHVPLPPNPDVPAHDVLFVGTGFPERNEFLKAVTWPEGTDVALYGHWDSLASRSKLRRFVKGGVLSNEAAAWHYRGAKINLNLHRKRIGYGGADEVIAASVNPRCMELAALGRFFISDPRPELHDLFGGLVPIFETPEELAALVAEWLPDDKADARAQRGEQIRACVEHHSWGDRAKQVVADLASYDAPSARWRRRLRKLLPDRLMPDFGFAR